MNAKPVFLYDTTLRDGTQGEGFQLSGLDKLRITERLDALAAHLYDLTRDEFSYILNIFLGLHGKALAAFGEFQSKRNALEEFE